MIRRICSIASLLLVITAVATPVWAEQSSTETEGAEAAAESHGPVGLPWDAVNWVNFDYQSEETEEAMAEHGVHHPGPPVIAVVFNTAVLALILFFLARKPLTTYLQARSDSVREGLSEAKKLLEEANEQLADYSARLERMDEEMSKLREEFIAAGEAERDRLVAEAGAGADRMKRDAKKRLDQEFAHLREELRVETVEKAVDAATKALKESVGESDQRRLADEYLERVEQEGAGR